MATQFERAAQRGLLKCVERLGKFVEVEDEDKTVNEVYEKETDTTTYLMDVIRFLRKDNEELRPLRQLLCQWEIVQRHLLPLLTHYRNDRDLVMQIVRCMILLTGPVDPNARQADRQLLYLQQAKEAFLDQDALAVLMEVLVTILAKPERDVKTDQGMMEGILVLFKNLLAVPDPKPSTSSGDAHKHRLQDNFIMALFEENVFEFYMHLLQNINRSENKKFLHLMLETVYLLFHRDSPADLVTAHQDALTSKSKEVSVALKTQVAREKKYSELLTNVTHGARHQRFGGCFVTTSTDGSKSIKNKSVQRILPRDVLPKPLTNPRGRKRLASDVAPQSSSRVQVILKGVGEQIIEYCYNDFVAALARDKFEAKKTLEASEDQYHWFIGYFVGLNHHIQLAKKSQSAQDSAAPSFDVTSVSVSVTFDTLREMVDKCQAWFELKQWHRLQLVMRAFKELITNVVSMYASADAELKRAARILSEKLFYHRELCLDRLVQFIRGFNPSKQTKTYLVDLIQVIHAVLKLLELETSGSRKLITRKKRSGRSTHANKGESEEFVQDKQYAEGERPAPTEGDTALVEGAADDALSVSDDEDGHISDDTYLTVPQYLALYAKASVLRPYLLVLKDYMHNSEAVNHMIVKMFYRLADKPLHYRGLFYQITVLRVFNQILNDPMIEHDAHFKEMRSFAAHIVRHFITDLQKKPEVKGIEVLFWRHKGECLSNGSSARDDDEGPDRPEEEVDFDIDAELKHAANTRASEESNKKRRVTKKTVRKVTRVSTHEPQPREWSEEEVEELRTTYARYSTGPDCLDVIVNLMTDVTVCQCHHKLQELGLIAAEQRCPEATDEEVVEEEEIEVEVSEEDTPALDAPEEGTEDSTTRSGRSIFRSKVEEPKKGKKRRSKKNKKRERREEETNSDNNESQHSERETRDEHESSPAPLDETALAASEDEASASAEKKHKKRRDKKSKKSRKEKKHKSSKKRKREQSEDESALKSDQLELDLALDDEDERPTKRRRLMPMSQED